MNAVKGNMLLCGLIVLTATSVCAYARDDPRSRAPKAPFAIAQDPRIFIVEAGGDPSTTTANTNIELEAEPGSTIDFDIYAEITSGGSVDVSGFEFSMACTSTGGDGGVITYDPASVTATGDNFFFCLGGSFDTEAPGNCAVPDEPGGLAAVMSPDSCALSGPVLIGTIFYSVPADAGTSDPAGNPYVIAVTGSDITDTNQDPLPNLLLDGANVTVHTGDLSLNVATGSEKVMQGETVTVTLDVADLSTAINGVQALIHYDMSLLSLTGVEPEDLGLTLPPEGWVEIDQDDQSGDLAYAAVINGDSTSADGTVATLTFMAIGAGSTSITFLSDNPANHPTLVTELTRADTAQTIDPKETPSGTIIINLCDDENDCTDDTFDGANCVYTPRANGSPCGDTGNTECTDPDTCLAGACQDNHASSGDPCGDQGIDCLTDDTCDGSGLCTDNGYWSGGASCGDTGNTECTDPDTCLTGACQDNHASLGDPCGDQGIDCLTDDTCDGSGSCTDNGYWSDGASCGDAGDTECTDPDTCDGAGTCDDNHEPNGTVCEVDGSACTEDECTGTGTCVTVLTTPCLTVNLEIEALIGDAGIYPPTAAHPDGSQLDRDVTLVLTTCGGAVDTQVQTVSFTADVGNGVGTGTALLMSVDPSTDYVGVQENHTLRTLVALDLAVSDTVDVSLTAGDFFNAYVPQNNVTDIQDFAILAIEWNQPVDPELGMLADATGDGMQSMDDFTVIQAHFAEAGDGLDMCAAELEYTDRVGEMPRAEEVRASVKTRIAVEELGFPHSEYADVNADGLIDVYDIRAFAELRGLPLLPEFEQRLARLHAAEEARAAKASAGRRVGRATPSGP